MFRHRVRPPLPPLDEVTAERLLRGAPIDDLPEAYQPLGQLLADARRPATEAELEGSAAAAATFVAAHAANQPRRRAWSLGASALLAVTLAASTGTAVAATQGALPQPMQQVAHEALGAVGISVPGIQHERDHNDEDGSTTAGTSTDPTAGGAVASTTPTFTTTPTNGTPGTPTDVEGTTGGGANGDTDQAPEGVAGENPNAGPGNNSGQGNPNPGEGNQGNGNAGGGQGNQGGGQVVTPEPPADNLPPQSNGNGNGPPQVPPGQAKK